VAHAATPIRPLINTDVDGIEFTAAATVNSEMTSTSAAVLALVSARTGHFLLESGHHGDLWLDLDAVFWSPTALAPLVAEMSDRLRPYAPDAVCGPLVGGALLAQLVAARLGTSFCYTERTATEDGSTQPSTGCRLPRRSG
jgi:orotate phosphoribosyltransferase